MKRNFTLLMAAFALMVCMMPMGMMGQTTTTYTFSSKAWAATPDNWTSGKDGSQMQSGRGVQVTTSVTGANATSPISFTDISKVEVTYSTNANAGEGSIVMQIGSNTSVSKSVTKTGGTTDRVLTFNYSSTQTGKVKFTVNCTTNSIYVKSISITYSPSAAGTGGTDVLNREFTGISGTSYVNWSGKTGESGAVYAGNSAGGNDAIQLRSSNSNSGIITTTSGGKVTKVVVTWESNTSSGRTLDIYGKNSAYSSASDLYSSNTQGTKLGSIVYGTSTTLNITGDYTYIGLRSSSGAIYLTEIQITWESQTISTVATPTFSPAAGTYNSAQSVTLSCATTGATIHYTTDGSIPSESSATYSSAISVSSTTTIKAIAVKSGMNNSEVASATYTIATPCTITFNPGAGTCGTPSMSGVSGSSITLPTATPSTECAGYGWTFAGWATSSINETTTAPTLLTGSYTIAGDVTLYAVYKAEAGMGSQTTTFNFANIASANNWTNGTQYRTVSLSPITLNAFGGGNSGKYYTSDHTWRIYSSDNGGVTVSSSSGNITEVSSSPSRSFTISNGGASFTASSQTNFSSISVTYEVPLFNYATSPICMEQAATPTFTPAGGDYSTAQTVTINCATEDATIYYTTDGTAPSTSSSVYSTAISVSETTTIKAMATKSNMANSEIATATYNIVSTINVDQPSFSLPYTASSGSFGFTITNPVSGAAVTATTADDWITPSVSGNTVSFQVAENIGNGRSGNITLSYVLNNTTLTSVAVSVNQEPNPNQPGGQNNPYTVAQAVAATPSSGSSDWVYVRGIVSEIIEIEVIQYHNAKYNISDDGGTSSTQLLCFYGYNIDNTQFLSEDELLVGDEVVVYGQLKNYNGTEELDRGNYIVSLYRAVEPVTFNPPSCIMTSGSYASLFSEAFNEWDAEVYYTTDGSVPTTTNGTYFDVWGDLIELTQTTTIKAVTYVPDLDMYSSVTEATYTIVSPEDPGWSENPYSVSEALDALDINPNIKGAYVHGIVSRIVQIETTQYFNATYYIRDENDPNDTLQVYRGKYISRADFTSQDDIQVGDIVTVFGDLTIYNSTTKEFKPKNYIYDFYRPTSIIISQNQIEVDCNATFGIINVTYSDDILVNAYHPVLQFCDAQGNAASYDWLTVTLSEDTNWDLEYEISANNGDQARTAYLKILYHDTDSNLDVVSNIISITQSEFQIDYATLPFYFNGGRDAIESTVGLKEENLGTDYNSAPKLKFDKQNSALVLKINEVPGVLSYDIRSYLSQGSYHWSGTFTVQVSTDGATWLDHLQYQTDDLTTTVRHETISDLPVSTRYIRWIYTTKSGGNVALGNINLEKPILYYDVVLLQPQEGGTIVCDKETAAEGETVLLLANVSEGYVLADWDVLDEDNNPITVEGDGSAAYSFTMPASDVTVEAIIVPNNTEFHYVYSVNGAEGESQTASVGTTLTLNPGSNINGQQFTFVGWSTNANNVENVMRAGASYRLSRDVTFYAVYVESVAGTSAQKQYVRVTEDLETNWAGDYLIACSDAIFANGQTGGTSGLGNRYNSVTPGANLHDNAVESIWGDSYYVTLEEIVAGSNTYLLKTQDGKYNYYTTNNDNGLSATDNRSLAASYPITVVFESVNEIQLSLGGDAEGSVFRYNPQGFFRFYKDGGQQPVYLYKKTVSAANRYTRVFVDNPSGDIVIAGPSIVPNGSVLNVSSITNNLGADRLVVAEGGQLVTSSNVNATIKRFVNPYQGEYDNYYLISSPIDGQDPVAADMTNGNYDLYSFDQSEQGEEWQNYEINMFSTLERGKGYLYANNYGGNITMSGLMEASADDVTIEHVSGKNFAGWNLIGNPYPCNVTIDRPYYRLAEGGAALATDATDNSVAIAPMEGVFVYADEEDDITFTKAPTTSTTGRGRNTLSMRVSRNRGTKGARLVEDNAMVRFGEGSLLRKLALSPNNAQLYVSQDGTDYAIVNAEAEGELPVSFRAVENGSYTFNVNAEEVSFNYLHLIDNKTGADVDLLQTPSYSFEATTADYTSRFRLVFSANNAEDATDSETFAFFNGSQWVVDNEGDATLQVVDVMGRVLSSQAINGAIEISIREAQGIYLLRLLNGDSVKVQKIVIQ